MLLLGKLFANNCTFSEWREKTTGISMIGASSADAALTRNLESRPFFVGAGYATRLG
jgi:hypothetical protein